MSHMIDSMAFHPGCGGTLHTGGRGEQAHTACSRCHAFRYDSDSDESFPTGTDAGANQAAWDDGCEERSPDA